MLRIIEKNPTDANLADYLAALDGVKRSGAGRVALCPAHDDKNASLSIRVAEDGRVLLHCFAGCSYSEIMAALARERDGNRDPIKRSTRCSRRPEPVSLTKSRITLAALAEARRLPVEFLTALGLRNLPFKTGIEIPYFDETKRPLLVKRRLYLDLADAEQRAGLIKFRWPARTTLVAYGLWLLKLARRAKRLVLVEGESDCWTLWLHGIPALGLPGNESPRTTLKGEYLRGIKKLLVVQEDDRGGAAFVRNVATRLRELGFKENTSVFDMKPTGAKDVSDLYLSNPKNFKGWFASWLR